MSNIKNIPINHFRGNSKENTIDTNDRNNYW